MRAADLPGRLPQAPSGRDQQHRNDCSRLRTGVYSVPPKASTHRNLEPDPIYPLSTLLVRVGVWQRPCHLPEATRQTIPVSGFLGNSLELRGAPELSGSHAVHLRYIQLSAADDNHSLPVGQTSLSVSAFKFSTVRRPTRRTGRNVCPTAELLPIHPSLPPYCRNEARSAADHRVVR